MANIVLVNRLKTEGQTVEEMLDELPPPGWVDTFLKAKAEIKLFSNILRHGGEFYPPMEKLVRTFDLCPLDMVKLVIVGQDPYYSNDRGRPQANGLAFSTDKGHPVQPSLSNIYNELEMEFPVDTESHRKFVRPNHGDLSGWVEQGVLMMNTTLTVAPGMPNSHSGISDGIISRVVNSLNERKPNCIYLLWGKDAMSFSRKLGANTIKFYATHPSGRSAYRKSKNSGPFIGCNHFKMANDELIKQGLTPINWCLD